MDITLASSASDLEVVRLLFSEYAASLAIDLGFQEFEKELQTLPGEYGPPRGALLLARADGKAAGCVGLRPFSGDIGEIKRLYVVPAFRRQGISRALVSSIIEFARQAGYHSLVLDTLDCMAAAVHVYEALGFVRTSPYYPNPLPNVLYFRKTLP